MPKADVDIPRSTLPAAFLREDELRYLEKRATPSGVRLWPLFFGAAVGTGIGEIMKSDWPGVRYRIAKCVIVLVCALLFFSIVVTWALVTSRRELRRRHAMLDRVRESIARRPSVPGPSA